MKKLLLLLFAAVGIGIAAQAQRAELQLGYGGYTQMDATNMHEGSGVKNAWGALTAGLNFKVMPNLYIGPSYTFSSSSYKGGGPNLYYHVIMLNGRYNYWHNRIVTLYGHLGVGADITHTSFAGQNSNNGYFAFQISPVGATVGLGRSLSMFGELGFGAQGLLQVGVRYSL